MALPLKDLPIIQNWSCHTCGDCCRRLEGVITNEDKERIESLDLADDPEIAPKPWFARASRGSKHWRLAHRPDGGCVFLTSQNHCRLQERFGPEVKPFVCRLFPFILVPAGNHWRVGMRFSCPSTAANLGPPVTDAEDELVDFTRLLEQHVGRSADSAIPPPLQLGQQIPWPDLCRLALVMVDIVKDRRYPVERRLRICLAVSRICAQTNFDTIKGNRLTEYLQAVRRAMETEIPAEATDLPAPDKLLGKVPFSVFLAIYSRREPNERLARRIDRRLARVFAGLRFVMGRGDVPHANASLPHISFDEVERRTGLLAEADETLERYYAVKLNSLQFCGGPNFGMTFLDGLASLILTYPMIMWLARAFTDLAPTKAVEQAIQLVDDQFGGNPMLGFPHIRFLLHTLAQRGELDKLVAWYSR